MAINKVEYKFISRDSKFYEQAVTLRYEVFFKPNGVSIDAVFDSLEDSSFHLAAIYEDKVVGYIRLTVNCHVGQLSQFVVTPSMRGKKSIAKKLFEEITLKAREEKVCEVFGEIRLHVAKVAEAYGFSLSEETFPSTKTGILHRRIEKKL